MHTSKQIMSFVIIFFASVHVLIIATDPHGHRSRSEMAAAGISQSFSSLFSGISELPVCVLIDQDHPGSG